MGMRMNGTSSNKRIFEKRIRVALAALGSALLIVGFMTPQIVQGIEFDSRGDYVAQMATNARELSTLEYENSALTVHLGLQALELQRLAQELKQLSAVVATSEEIPAEAKQSLEAVVTKVNASVTTYEEYVSTPELREAKKIVERAIREKKTDAQHEVLTVRSASWFLAPTDQIAYLFDVKQGEQLKVATNVDKMTNAEFAELKEEIADSEQQLRKLSKRHTELLDDFSAMQTVGSESFMKDLEPFLKALPELSEEFIAQAEYYELDVEPLQTMAAKLADSQTAEMFTRSKDGKLSPVAAGSASKEGDTAMPIGETRRLMVVSYEARSFLKAWADISGTVLEHEEEAAAAAEQRRLLAEQQEREAAEQAERERQQQEETEQPATPTPTPTPPPVEEPQPEPDPEPQPPVTETPPAETDSVSD